MQNFIKQKKREKGDYCQEASTSLQRKQKEKIRKMLRSSARMNKRNSWGA